MTSTSTTTKIKDKTKSESSNARLRIGTRDKSVGWYIPTLTHLSPETQTLFENYSQIPSADIIPHILSIRDRAWDVHPYPFIGLLHFASLTLSQTPSYNHIITSLQSGSNLLDIGCGFGQDLRKLLYDGAPATSLYGLDVKPELVDLGHELFNDKASWGGKTTIGDLFEKNGKGGKSKVGKLEGKMDFVFIGLFLHLFDYATQLRACEKVVRLLKSKTGAMVVGHQVGSVHAGEVKTGGGRVMYKHDVASFGEMWKEVGKKTGTKWSVWTWLEEGNGKAWDDEGTRRLVFEVVRVN